jgi:tRNA (guanine37-N1)-methyltransferase
MRTPDVLLSGDHKKIREWQRQQSLIRTFERRPDLLKNAPLSEEDLDFLDTLKEGDT